MNALRHLCVIAPKLAPAMSRHWILAPVTYLRLIGFLISKKIFHNNTPWRFQIYLEKRSVDIFLFEGSPDVAALAEIYLDHEYKWPEEFETPKYIVDLGAHTGNTALYFHLLYPQAIIYAVEASPKNYGRLLENCDNIENIIPINRAVHNTNGQVMFYETKSSLGSGFTKQRNSQETSVTSVTLKALFAEFAIPKADLMKIDIEGAEALIFDALEPESFAARYMMEVHVDLMSDVEHSRLQSSFEKFKITSYPTSNPQRYLLYAKM